MTQNPIGRPPKITFTNRIGIVEAIPAARGVKHQVKVRRSKAKSRALVGRIGGDFGIIRPSTNHLAIDSTHDTQSFTAEGRQCLWSRTKLRMRLRSQPKKCPRLAVAWHLEAVHQNGVIFAVPRRINLNQGNRGWLVPS